MADALRRKNQTSVTTQRELLRDLEMLEIVVCVHRSNVTLAAITIQPSLLDEIKVAQKEDPQLQDIKERIKNAHET